MSFDKSVPVGQSPFFRDAPLSPIRQVQARSRMGVIPPARPPRLWAPLQVPQKDSHEVNLQNITAPITSPTRPYSTDASGYDGASLGAHGFMSALNGGG